MKTIFSNPVALTSTLFPSEVRQAINLPGTNYIFTTEAGGPTVRKIDISTQSQIQTWTVGSQANTTISLLNGAASGICANSSNSQLTVFELISTYTTTLAPGVNCGTTFSNQFAQAAFDSLNCVYFPVSSSNSGIVKFNWSTWTVSTVQPDDYYNPASNKFFRSLGKTPSGTMFAGTNQAQLYEIDPSTMQIIGMMDFPYYDYALPNLDENSVISNPTIVGWVIQGDYVYAFGNWGERYLVHWPSKTIMSRTAMQAPVVTSGSIVATVASGIMFHYNNCDASDGILTATDITQHPAAVQDYFFINGGNPWQVDMGVIGSRLYLIHGLSGTWRGSVWSLPSSGFPTTASVTSTLVDGTAVAGRVFRVIDYGSSSQVYFDTPVTTSGETCLIATGQTVLEFAVYGTGVNEKGALSTYQT